MHWVIAAAVAGQIAWVGAPLARADVDAWWWHLPAVSLLVFGLVRRSQAMLVAGVPVAWAVVAYGLPRGAFAGPLAVVSAAATLAYLVAALRWSRGDGDPQALAWTADGAQTEPTRDPMPWVAAFLVGGPAMGVLLWPAIPRAAAAGFPRHAGQVTVALALLATLVGLALATDLARGRYALVGDRSRAWVLATVSAGALALWAGLALS